MARTAFLGGVWPPKDIHTFDPWHLPLLNTLILLTSGTTVTWAHHALLENNRKGLIWGLVCTIALGMTFTCVQAYEYGHAAFHYSGNIYGATFFMATGFHGAHVIIGSVFLIVCLVRALDGQFTPTQHLGFEFAAWYWHFVDVVWLFLFACIYVWGAGAPPPNSATLEFGRVRAGARASQGGSKAASPLARGRAHDEIAVMDKTTRHAFRRDPRRTVVRLPALRQGQAVPGILDAAAALRGLRA